MKKGSGSGKGAHYASPEAIQRSNARGIARAKAVLAEARKLTKERGLPKDNDSGYSYSLRREAYTNVVARSAEPAAPQETLAEIRLAYPPPSRAAGRTGSRSSKNDRRGRRYLVFPSWSKNAIGGFTYNLARRIPGYKFEPGIAYEVWCSGETTKITEAAMLKHFGRVGKSEWCRATRETAAAYGMTRVPNL